MIFAGLKENNGWMVAEYRATWKYGYDFMLDAAQIVIDTDFREGLQRIAVAKMVESADREIIGEVNACGNVLRNCKTAQEECSVLTIAGVSSIMECPVQFSFYNQTNIVRLYCPFKQYFEEHGDHVFDNYMNSVEIKAYCKDTERRTLARTTD